MIRRAMAALSAVSMTLGVGGCHHPSDPPRAPAFAPAGATAAPSNGAIVLADLDGHPVPLADVQRDATFLAFWSLTCEPCLEEMPSVEALSSKVAGDAKVTVLGINLDEATPETTARVRALLQAKKVTYRTLQDPSGALRRVWYAKVDEIPRPITLLFDRKMNAVQVSGYSGAKAEDFVSEWLPRIADTEAGKLDQHLATAHASHGMGPDDMRPSIEAMIRKHHPELTDAEVKQRVDEGVDELKAGKPLRMN
jgi:thiol-disulfide isomerase/thioredoxin